MIKKHSRVTVVNVVSPSFTGTTWFNMVLGCHERALAIGPLDHFLQQCEEGRLATCCQIHGESCTFWPRFADRYDARRNVFLQLREATGRDFFIVNNPQRSRVLFKHPGVDERQIVLLRDGRAVTASFHRKYPTHYCEDEKASYFQVVFRWWLPAIRYFSGLGDQPRALTVRYEDLIEDLGRELARIGESLGLVYNDDVDRYWEYEHHIPGGNGGPIYLAARFQGYAHPGDTTNDNWYGHYRKQLEAMKDGDRFHDERWRRELDPAMLYAFDRAAGEHNEQLGYARDLFPASDRPTLRAEHQKLLDELEAAAAS